MSEDRRSHKRVSIMLPVKWEAMSGSHEARTEDISLSGCFVNTSLRAELAEVASLEIQLPSGEWLPLKGEVTSYQPGIGFGVLFSLLTDDQEDALKKLLE